jgi:hypothetical protein
MQIESRLKDLQQVSTEVEKEFLPLTAQELNLKPASDKWSIAQCLHHLMVTNETYYSQFDETIAGDHYNSFYQNIGFISSLMGKQMVNDLGPERRKKFTNPPLFAPSQSDLPASIVNDFLAHQKRLEEYFTNLAKFDLNNTVIYSPVSKVIIYSLNDALKIIAVHEQRHLLQAKEVKKVTRP